MNNYAFSIRYGAVVIHLDYQEDMILDESNLRSSIENIQRNKGDFATEEAYYHALIMRQEALEYLLGNR